MDIKKARLSLNEMLDLCSRLEDDSLNETCSGIYNDVRAAKNVDQVIQSARELMVFVEEVDWQEFEDIKEEVENIFYSLLEESDEF